MSWLFLLAIVALVYFFRHGLYGLLTGRGSSTEVSTRSVFATEVVGESKYQRNLLKICGKRTPDGAEEYRTAVLVLESDNPHDSNAVRVDIDGLTVGYLPRARAIAWRRTSPVDRHACAAVIRGGWDRGGSDKGSYGVWLDL